MFSRDQLKRASTLSQSLGKKGKRWTNKQRRVLAASVTGTFDHIRILPLFVAAQALRAKLYTWELTCPHFKVMFESIIFLFPFAGICDVSSLDGRISNSASFISSDPVKAYPRTNLGRHDQIILNSHWVICRYHATKRHPKKTHMMLLMVQKSCQQLRLVVYPIICKVFYIPGGWPWDFFHQQYINSNYLASTSAFHILFPRLPISRLVTMPTTRQ